MNYLVCPVCGGDWFLLHPIVRPTVGGLAMHSTSVAYQCMTCQQVFLSRNPHYLDQPYDFMLVNIREIDFPEILSCEEGY